MSDHSQQQHAKNQLNIFHIFLEFWVLLAYLAMHTQSDTINQDRLRPKLTMVYCVWAPGIWGPKLIKVKKN